MKYEPKRGKELPGIPGGSLPRRAGTEPETDVEELLQRFDIDEGEDDLPEVDFIPQQQLPQQKDE